MSWHDNKQRRVCIDNGAQTLRIGLAGDKQQPMQVFNAIGTLKKGKQIIGNKILEEFEKGQPVILEQPLARGLLHNIETQAIIWRDSFQKLKKFDASLSSLSLTVAPVVPDMVQN